MCNIGRKWLQELLVRLWPGSSSFAPFVSLGTLSSPWIAAVDVVPVRVVSVPALGDVSLLRVTGIHLSPLQNKTAFSVNWNHSLPCLWTWELCCHWQMFSLPLPLPFRVSSLSFPRTLSLYSLSLSRTGFNRSGCKRGRVILQLFLELTCF